MRCPHLSDNRCRLRGLRVRSLRPLHLHLSRPPLETPNSTVHIGTIQTAEQTRAPRYSPGKATTTMRLRKRRRREQMSTLLPALPRRMRTRVRPTTIERPYLHRRPQTVLLPRLPPRRPGTMMPPRRHPRPALQPPVILRPAAPLPGTMVPVPQIGWTMAAATTGRTTHPPRFPLRTQPMTLPRPRDRRREKTAPQARRHHPQPILHPRLPRPAVPQAGAIPPVRLVHQLETMAPVRLVHQLETMAPVCPVR